MVNSVIVDGKKIVECPRCKGLETIEHNHGWWCTTCACFAVEPAKQRIENAKAITSLDSPKSAIQDAPKKPATVFEMAFLAIFFGLMGLALFGLVTGKTEQSNNSQPRRSVSSGDDSGSGYAAGYAWALKKGIVTKDYCGGDSESFIRGCEDSADDALKSLKESVN